MATREDLENALLPQTEEDSLFQNLAHKAATQFSLGQYRSAADTWSKAAEHTDDYRLLAEVNQLIAETRVYCSGPEGADQCSLHERHADLDQQLDGLPATVERAAIRLALVLSRCYLQLAGWGERKEHTDITKWIFDGLSYAVGAYDPQINEITDSTRMELDETDVEQICRLARALITENGSQTEPKIPKSAGAEPKCSVIVNDSPNSLVAGLIFTYAISLALSGKISDAIQTLANFLKHLLVVEGKNPISKSHISHSRISKQVDIIQITHSDSVRSLVELLSNLYVVDNRPMEAARRLEICSGHINGNTPQSLVHLKGHVLWLQGDVMALTRLLAVTKRDPAWAHNLRACVHAVQGRPEHALSQWLAAITQGHGPIMPVIHNAAIQLAAMGRHTEAHALATHYLSVMRAQQDAASTHTCHNPLALSFTPLKESQSHLPVFLHCHAACHISITRPPLSEATMLRLQARSACLAGMWDEGCSAFAALLAAATGLDETVMQGTPFASTLNLFEDYSWALIGSGRYADCVSLTDTVCMAHPHSVALSLDRCESLLQLGEYERAVDSAQSALGLLETNTHTHHPNKAIRLDDEETFGAGGDAKLKTVAYTTLGLSLLCVDCPREALRSLRAALHNSPGCVSARHNYALALACVGRTEDAGRVWASKDAMEHVETVCTWVAASNGASEDAAAAYATLNELFNGSSSVI